MGHGLPSQIRTQEYPSPILGGGPASPGRQSAPLRIHLRTFDTHRRTIQV